MEQTAAAWNTSARAKGRAPAAIRFFLWMMRAAPVQVGAAFAFDLAVNLVPAASVWITRLAATGAVAAYHDRNDVPDLIGYVVAWSLFGVARGVLWPVLQLVQQGLIELMEDKVRSAVQEKTTRLLLSVLDSTGTVNMLRYAQEAAAPGAMFALVSSLLDLPSLLAGLVATAGLVVRWSMWLVVPIVLVALPRPAARWLQARMQVEARSSTSEPLRLADYYEKLLTDSSIAAEIRLSDVGTELVRRWRYAFSRGSAYMARLNARQASVRGLLASLSAIGLGGAVTIATLLVTQGAVSGATFVSVLFGLQAIQFGLGQLMETFGVILEQTVLLEGFMSYLELGPEEASGRHVGNPTGLIELKNVSFRYSPNASETLCGVTFRVEAGEHVAIVGPNGAGKSTLARVIAGLFRATEGAVLWDGIDLWEWDRECIRRSIAWVFQDYLRYALPFAENVGCGLVSQVNDMGQVYAASRMAGADKIAEVLPHGYHTVLTTQFSGGVELSKGQWQRVALARSFMRKSPVIIFDEPTAALDPVTECEIVAGLLRFAEGRTAFIVSHRLGVARLCDRVIVLDNGRVVEHGTHDELLGRKGLYCGMWRQQAEWYEQ